MSNKPLNWRAPKDIRDWLEAQPGGASSTLARLCRVAMGVELDPKVLELEGRIAELRRIVDRLEGRQAAALEETQAPAPSGAPARINSLW